MVKIFNLDNPILPIEDGQFIYPGGEPGTKIDPSNISGKNIIIIASIQNSEDFMMLVSMLSAIEHMPPPKILSVFIPYFPGARQDRPQVGKPFSLKMYADILGQFKIDNILLCDPHSKEVVNNLNSESILLPNSVIWGFDCSKYDGIICPDHGAIERTQKFAAIKNIKSIIYMEKVRDSETGNLSGFALSPNQELIYNGNYLVFDDICDGGGTFIGIAQVLKQSNCQLDLCVTHGIFSKGVTELLTYYNNIFTTDSIPYRSGDIENNVFRNSLKSSALSYLKGYLNV